MSGVSTRGGAAGPRAPARAATIAVLALKGPSWTGRNSPGMQRGHGGRGRGGRAGFTALELLLTLVLFAFVAATSIHVYFAQADVTLENAAILLARDLRAAQHRSTYTGEQSLFYFVASGDGYLVTGPDGEVVHNPQTDEPFERSYSRDGVFRGVRIDGVLAADGDRILVYDALGMPLEDVEIRLVYRGSTRVVQVEQESGRILVLGSTSGFDASDV